MSMLCFTLYVMLCYVVLYIACSKVITVPVLSLLLANVNSGSRSLYAIARPSVCLSSVTLVRPTQAVQIFGNISTAFDTLATIDIH